MLKVKQTRLMLKIIFEKQIIDDPKIHNPQKETY